MKITIEKYNGVVDSVLVDAAGSDARDLLAHLTTPTPVPAPASFTLGALIDAVQTAHSLAMNKIGMIKFVKKLTGWGLKEAKDFVEQHMPKPGDQFRY